MFFRLSDNNADNKADDLKCNRKTWMCSLKDLDVSRRIENCPLDNQNLRICIEFIFRKRFHVDFAYRGETFGRLTWSKSLLFLNIVQNI